MKTNPAPTIRFYILPSTNREHPQAHEFFVAVPPSVSDRDAADIQQALNSRIAATGGTVQIFRHNCEFISLAQPQPFLARCRNRFRLWLLRFLLK